MGSEYNYDALGSLFGASSSSQDPLAGLFDPSPDATHPNGTGGNLQLAPLYNNPRHQQEREGIGDILNRYQGRTGRPRHGDFYEDNYEEDLESHMSFDASGMHVGVRMSRSQQTPYGTARTSVGMQMSIGHGGMMFRSRSSSSLGGGGRGGLLMMAGFGGSPYHSLGQSMFEPMGSMLSPLGGLLSPLGGMFSPMIGSYNPGQEPSLFGFRRPQQASSQTQGMNRESDGPIIEEIFDEEESKYLGSRDGSAFSSKLAVEYKEEEIDPSLGLGLLPDMETVYSGHNQSRSEQGESGSMENGILNDFAFTEAALTAHNVRQTNEEEEDSGSHETDTNRTQSQTVTLHTENQEDRYSFARKTKVNRNESSELTDRTLIENNISRGLLEVKNLQQSDNIKEDVQSKSKEKAKFTKQTFRNSPLKLNKDHDSLPFLRPPQETNTSFNTVQSDLVCAPKMKINKNKQMNKSKLAVVNKNSVVRRRSDSSCSSSSEQSWTAGDNVRRPSEEIFFKPKSQLFSEEQNDDTITAATRKKITVTSSAVLHECPKTHEYPKENNRVISQEKHLSENTDGRYESLQDSDDDLKLVDGETSHNVYANKDVQPESLQKAMENGTADKTSRETSYKTSEVDTYGENSTHEITSARETTDKDSLDRTNIVTVSMENRQSPTLVSHQGSRDDPDKKSNSIEQAVRYEQHNGKLGAECRVETEVQKIKEQKINATHDKLNDTECKLENESNAEMFRRSSSPQDFSTYESDAGNQDKKQSGKDMNTASKRVEDERVPLQKNENTERESSLGDQFHDEGIDEREKHRAENVSEVKPRDRSVNLGTTKDKVYSQHEGARTLSVLETFQFEPEEDMKMHKAGSNDIKQGEYHSSNVNSERGRTKNLEHMSVPNQHQSNHRRQNMNESTINEDYGTDIEWQYPGQEPRSHHESFSVNKFALKHHPYQRKGISHSGGCHCHHMCEQMERQLQCGHEHIIETSCMTHRYRCHYCSEVMSPEGYCKRTHRCHTCGDEVMSLEDYNKREPDNDDIYQHPDWQHLNEYRDENGQFTNPRPRTNKPKVNKNATANTSSTASFSRQGQSSASGVQETASCSNNFGGLVESVGLTMKDVYPDGNCLFTAICDQLRIRGDFSYTPRDLRNAAVDYLREHPNQDDGTPLLAFLADEERNWNKYLSSMRRDGHWGDHFVIWALAHVLNRRFVIYRGNTELHRTVVEPSGPMSDDAIEDINADSEGATEGSECKEIDEDTTHATNQQSKPMQTDGMYLGHISESHYVSLRPTNWREELFKELKNKKTSSLIGCNPESKSLDSNGDVSVRSDVISFTSSDLDYFLNYLRRGRLVLKIQMSPKLSMMMTNEHCESHAISDVFNGFEYKLWSNMKTKPESLPSTAGYILTTPHDTTVVLDRRHGNVKDLILYKDGFKTGQFKLTPVKPNLWKPKLIFRDGCPFLRHIEHAETSPKDFPIGFKCSSWPEEAMEWKTRRRPHGLPSQSTIDIVVETGVRVVPVKVAHKYKEDAGTENEKFRIATRKLQNVENTSMLTSEGPSHTTNSLKEECDFVWEYDFAISESIICQRDIGTEVKTLHCILEAVTNFAFEEKNLITKQHFKTLTFFICEKFSSEEISHEPGKCLAYALHQLEEYLQKKHFPHYFMRGRNLIADMEYGDIVWHVERLQILKTNLMAILYYVLDNGVLQNVCDVGKVFDGLVQGAGKRIKGQDTSDTYLVRLCVTSVTNLLKRKVFEGVEKRIDTWYSELVHTYDDQKTISKEQFVHKILCDLSSQEEWLFALYLDCQEGSEYLQHVCKGKACVQLENLFGNEAAFFLSKETSFHSREIYLPTSILGEGMAKFASRLAEVVRYDIGSENAYQSAIHHFLGANTHDLLLSVEKDQRDKKDYNLHLKLSSLDNMYNDLYDSYQEERNEHKFRNLMELYGELCNFIATENSFRFLADLWAYFGDNDRAREAKMKADSVRDETNMM